MRYAVVGRLGRGGMGVVDLAHDEDGRPVALKRVPLAGSSFEMADARRRIRREAEVLRSLDHPGIVSLLDVLDDGDDVVLVMPHLGGGTLADRVRLGGPLPAMDVAVLAGSLLPALAAAHRQGVVHRDLKPANVLFDDDGRSHLADFGVALSRDLTVGLTGGGLVVGTPAFMAPEQARGEPVGAPADVFALGATLRFALTGRDPYGDGDARSLMRRAAAGKVERLPRSVPVGVRRHLDAMCDPDPRRRPTAAALAGGPAGTAVRTRRWPSLVRRRGRRLAVPAVAAVGLVAVGALALAARPSGDEATATPTTRPAPPCQDLPYQPCGAEPAPFTDGRSCTDDHDDYDADPVNGCEAAPDRLADGAPLVGRLAATLVPRADVDRYELDVVDRAQLLCDGELKVTLTAPAGVAQRVRVLDGDDVVAEASSANATPATAAVPEPGCFSDDGTTLVVEVSSVGSDRSAEPYALSVRGSF